MSISPIMPPGTEYSKCLNKIGFIVSMCVCVRMKRVFIYLCAYKWKKNNQNFSEALIAFCVNTLRNSPGEDYVPFYVLYQFE